MTDINAWNAVDDSNNVASPAGWPEGMMPSGVNDSARAMMGSIKRWRDQIQPTAIATGSPNAQIITYPVAPAALAQGDVFTFTSVGTNTGPVTLQVNAQPAHPVLDAQALPLVGGEMPGSRIVSVYYGSGGNFRLANDPAGFKKSGDTMTGPLTVPALTVSGAATAGSLTTPTLNVSGNASVGGTLTTGALSLTSPLPIASGGTAGTTQAAAFNNIATLAASSGNPGYMKFPNGLLMQWGQTGTFLGSNLAPVTFPIAFSTFVTVQLTFVNDAGSPGVQSLTLNGFTANAAKNSGGFLFWFAIGF